MSESFFHVSAAPPDPLFGLVTAYNNDNAKVKINLSVGAYRDENGKPWVLPVVKEADELIHKDPNFNHEYLSMSGLPEFTDAAAKLIFGSNSDIIKSGKIATVQTVSGTGALHLATSFFKEFPVIPGKIPTIYIPNPTWANHPKIFEHAGIEVQQYKYANLETLKIDIDSLIKDISSVPDGSIILLHACAHNPTGIDPTREEWERIVKVFEQRHIVPLFDCAYQGFASGNLQDDAWAINYFLSKGLELLVTQSFSKNMGLYGERAGALHIVSSSKESAVAIKSQLAKLTRYEISNPPSYGARIANKILTDPELYKKWESRDLQTMANRIKKMRKALHSLLTEKYKTPGNWDHIITQIGMFSFTGLKPDQVKRLVNDYHIYLVGNGRISMAGLNEHNVEYFAKSVHDVVTTASPKI